MAKETNWGKQFGLESTSELLDYVKHLFYNASGGSQTTAHRGTNTGYGGVTVQDNVRRYVSAEFSDTCADVDFYFGNQWTDEDIKVFKAQGMDDPGHKNLMRQYLDTLIGVGAHLGARPLATPVNVPSDDRKAAAATSVVKYVWDNNKYVLSMRDHVIWHLVVPGTVAMEISYESKAKDTEQQICYNVLEWDRFSYDQKSRKKDFSDATFFFHRFWSDLSRYELDADFKITNQTGWEHMEGLLVGEHTQSYFGKKDFAYSVQVLRAVLKYQDEWWIIDCLPEKVLSVTKSPFVDQNGVSQCPIKAQSFYCDHRGIRHGLARDLRPAQRDVNLRNYFALKDLEHRIIVNLMAANLQDIDQLNNVRRVIGLRVRDGMRIQDAIEFVNNSSVDAKQFDLIAFGDNFMAKAAGVSEYLQGSANREDSGYAQDTKAQQSLVRVARLLTPLYNFETCVAETTFNIARDFWNEERIMKITDDPEAVEHIVLNQTITLGDLAMRQLKEHVEELAEQGEIADPAYVQQIQTFISQDPEAQQPIAVQNDIAEPVFDFMFEVVPEHPSQQDIELGMIREVSTHLPQIPELIPTVLRFMIKQTKYLAGKGEILEDLAQIMHQQMLAQQKALQEPSEGEIKVETAAIGLDKAKTETERAEVVKKMTEAQAKHQVAENTLKLKLIKEQARARPNNNN